MGNPAEIVVGLCFLAVGLGFTGGAIGLQIGGPTEPLPGFFPFLGGVALIFLAAVFLLQVRRGRAGNGPAFGKLRGPGTVVLALILYVVSLEWLGFVIATGLLSAVVLKVMQTHWRMLVPVSFVLATVCYILFDRFLGLTLPGGFLAGFF